MQDWAKFKYIAHVDGISCSSKLEQSLAVGSLVFKEESGYRSFFHRLLRPFVHYVPFWRERPQALPLPASALHPHCSRTASAPYPHCIRTASVPHICSAFDLQPA